MNVKSPIPARFAVAPHNRCGFDCARGIAQLVPLRLRPPLRSVVLRSVRMRQNMCCTWAQGGDPLGRKPCAQVQHMLASDEPSGGRCGHGCHVARGMSCSPVPFLRIGTNGRVSFLPADDLFLLPLALSLPRRMGRVRPDAAWGASACRLAAARVAARRRPRASGHNKALCKAQY
jgi:hypothetical protein